jgi:hypothetical protein
VPKPALGGSGLCFQFGNDTGNWGGLVTKPLFAGAAWGRGKQDKRERALQALCARAGASLPAVETVRFAAAIWPIAAEAILSRQQLLRCWGI